MRDMMNVPPPCRGSDQRKGGGENPGAGRVK